MDYFRKLRAQVALRITLVLVITNSLAVLSWWALHDVIDLPGWLSALATLSIVAVLAICAGLIIAPGILEPLRLLWQAILHVSPESQGTAAPNLDDVRLGRELVTSLSLQIYQLASSQAAVADTAKRQAVTQATNVIDHLPIPMFVCNRQQFVTNASTAGLEYCGIQSADLFGKPLFASVKLEFPSERTLEVWMNEAQKTRVTDSAYWERVRVRWGSDESKLHQCDMAAYYNRDDPTGTEFIITLFDRTEHYNQDDKAMGFVALAVHELRTPLTVLRGYIEVFEEELGETLNPELKDFMHKMQVSAEQLTAFVNNILNVARVDDDQLVLQLHEEAWPDVLQKAAADTELRARVRGKHVTYKIAEGLPTVAVDRVSIYEVISNLLDNAIKYSAKSPEIIVSATLGKDGTVVTTVQDFGVGIPESVLPNLFEKFYRNHRTRSEIGGTGLGLYLSKSIISAHGGQIWAQSKEGQGSTFGFSLIPFDTFKQNKPGEGTADITRTAHGWVKNHSLYRR